MNSEENDINNEVNEPGLNYQPMKKTLTFFKSFEEMNEADAMEAAKMDPLENLRNATAMIQLMYSDELKKPNERTITIGKHFMAE
jgi:hypothetical protein